MTATSVLVTGVGLWIPGRPNVAAWMSGTLDATATVPTGASLDRMNRRRLSRLGRALADAMSEAVTEAKVDPATVPTVIGSSIGEAATMLGLLDQMFRQEVPLSPAGFTMSVHNAASGVISISNDNRGFATSLAADEQTPAAALLEGIGLVATTGGPVAIACGDEAAPEDFVPDERAWGLLAASVVLAPAERDVPARSRLSISFGDAPSLAGADVGLELARNPQIGMLDLVAAVLRGSVGRVRLDRGGGGGWCASLEAVEPR